MKGLRTIFAVVVCLIAFGSIAAWSQAVNSTVVGTVTDSTGAVVVGAKVTLTETNTNVSHNSQTNESGNYVFADVPPGDYLVTVEMAGFKKGEQRGIALLVNTTQRVDVQLQPGAVTETVEVTAAPPALTTDSADTGRKIDTMVVAELPILVSNRNYQVLLDLVPGTTPHTEQHSQFFNASSSLQTQVNGTPRVGNNYQIEGIDDNERTGILQILIPPLEAVQTVDVSTSNHSVDMGRGTGAVTNVILKSGTNEFHGSLYEFLQNNKFDARNFFQPTVAAVHYNYFGGTIGGPIRKNKLFFFADFLRTSDHEANANTETIPSPLARTGNLSEALTGSNPAPVYDPATGDPSTGVGRTPFPGNIVPTSRLNPIALKILALVPNPNLAYSTLAPNNNYFALLPFTKDSNLVDGKMDFNISEKDRLSGRFSFQRPVVYQAPIFGTAGGNANGGFQGTGVQNTYSSGINWNHVFTPSLLNEFRFGVAHYRNKAQQSDYGTNASTALGIPGINISDFNSGLVGIGISSFTSPLVGYSASLPWDRAEANIDLVDNVTKMFRNHNLTIGFDMRRVRDELLQTQTYSARGFYQFGASQTNCAGNCQLPNGTTSSATTPNSTTSWANSLASFLLDMPQAGSTGRDFSGTFPTYRQWYFFPYFSDKWQVSQKLTVDIGLRWELYPPPVPRFAPQFTNYIPSNNTLVVAGVGGNPANGGMENHLNYLAPRLGMAYRLTDKTVLRAGIGVSYAPFQDNTYLTYNYPTKGNLGAVQNPNGSAYTAPLYNGSLLSFESGMPAPSPVPVPSNGIYSVSALGQNGTSEFYFPTDYKNPHVIGWNFSVQRALPAHFTVEVAYVGNHGVDMGSNRNINSSPWIAPSSTNNQVYQPYYPHTGTISQFFLPLSSMYNSLQAKADRRFAKGLSITTAFTFQKGMAYFNGGDDDGFYGFSLAGQFHRNWARTDFNRTVTFVQSYVYQLPFGKGQPFLKSGRALDAIVGGWQLQGMLTIMTGTPFTVSYSSTYLNLAAGGTNTPVQVGPATILHGINTTSNGGSAWFDPTAFAAPPCQSATPSAACPTGAIDQINGAAQQVGNVGRNSMIGPGFFNINLALSKNVNFSERFKLQLRLETVNTTNTPQFANPNGTCCTANNANFGFITSTMGSGSGTVNAGTGSPRTVQLAAKLTF